MNQFVSQNKKPPKSIDNEGLLLKLLPDMDSNHDKQYQKLSYYRYTIGQSVFIGVQK